MGMGHSLSHDTPHLPRGLLRSSLHSLVCTRTTTETPTLLHPERHEGKKPGAHVAVAAMTYWRPDDG